MSNSYCKPACEVCGVNLFNEPHAYWCGKPFQVPQDKPENYSPHTSVSDYCFPRHGDYLPPRDFGARKATITSGPIDGDGRSVEEIDYSKLSLPEDAVFSMPEGGTVSFHTGAKPEYLTTLPTDPAARKNIPITTGVLDYFPAAIAEVAYVSYVGNEKHNPGEDLHHARGKSMDHADCIARHLTERGTIDTVRLPDGREFKVRHSAYVAWRALALLQEELEAAGAPLARGAR